MATDNTNKKPLNFRMGPLANLQNVAYKGGTIYVTTDERAMYLDVDDTKRIRLGNAIVSVNSISEIATMKPWQEGTLYYSIKDDALVIYTGEEEGFKHVHHKLNATVTQLVDDFASEKTKLADLIALVGKVKDLPIFASGTEDKDKTVHNALSLLHTRVSALETTVGSATTGLVKDVADLKSTVGDANNGLVKQVNALESTVSSNKSTLDGEISRLKTRVSANESAIETHAGQYNTLKGVVDGHTNTIATLATKEELNSAKSTLQESIGEVDTKVGNVNTSLSNEKTRAETAEKALSDRIDGHDTRLTATENVANAAKTKAETNATEIARIGGVVGNDTAGLVKQVADLEAYKTSSAQDITGIKTSIAGLVEEDGKINTALSGHGTRIGALEAKDTELANAITDGDNAVKNLLAADKAELAEDIADVASDLTEFETAQTAENAAIRKAFADADVALGKRIDTVSQTASANSTNIASLQEAVGDINTSISDLQGEDDDIKVRLTELEKYTGSVEDASTTSLVERIATLENNSATSGALDKAVEDLNKAIDDLEKDVADTYVTKTAYNSYVETTAGTLSSLSVRIDGVVEDLKDEVTNRTNAVAGVQGQVDTLKTTVGDTTKGLVKQVNDLDNTVNHATTGLVKKVSDVTTKANTNASDITDLKTLTGTHTKNITDINAAITAIKDGTTIDSFKDVEDAIAAGFAANDALVFKGVLGGGAHTIDGVQSGWTYKASENDTYEFGTTKFENCRIGDLFIYVVNDSGVGEWQYVPSGNEDKDKIGIVNTDTTIMIHTQNNTPGTGVTFAKEAGTAITVTATAGQIAIGMEWETF